MTTVQGLGYYVSTTPDHTLAPTLTPLTDDEILDRYPALIWEALVAFATDPTYFEEICVRAYEVDERREAGQSSSEDYHRTKRLNELGRTLGAKVRRDGECWTWTAATGKNNTPMMRVAGKTITARSWTVEQWHGPDKTRWMIRPACGNQLCVNPEHATWRTVERAS